MTLRSPSNARGPCVALVVVLGFGVVRAFDDCVLDSEGAVVCDKTLYHGRCGTLYEPRKENWCRYQDIDVCCGDSVGDCCADSQAATICAIALLSMLCLCCVSVVCCKRISMLLDPRGASANPATAIMAPEFAEDEECAVAHERAVLAELCKSLEPRKNGGVKQQQHNESKECVVCMSRPRNIVLPCGHALLCQECTESILRSRNRLCPTCRARFHVYQSVSDMALPSYRDMAGPVVLPSRAHTSASDIQPELLHRTQLMGEEGEEAEGGVRGRQHAAPREAGDMLL